MGSQVLPQKKKCNSYLIEYYYSKSLATDISSGHISQQAKIPLFFQKSESEIALCDPMDYTVHWILQARILEWIAIPFSRGFSQPRDRTQVSRIIGKIFTSWATREALVLLGKIQKILLTIWKFLAIKAKWWLAAGDQCSHHGKKASLTKPTQREWELGDRDSS